MADEDENTTVAPGDVEKAEYLVRYFSDAAKLLRWHAEPSVVVPVPTRFDHDDGVWREEPEVVTNDDELAQAERARHLEQAAAEQAKWARERAALDADLAKSPRAVREALRHTWNVARIQAEVERTYRHLKRAEKGREAQTIGWLGKYIRDAADAFIADEAALGPGVAHVVQCMKRQAPELAQRLDDAHDEICAVIEATAHPGGRGRESKIHVDDEILKVIDVARSALLRKLRLRRVTSKAWQKYVSDCPGTEARKATRKKPKYKKPREKKPTRRKS